MNPSIVALLLGAACLILLVLHLRLRLAVRLLADSLQEMRFETRPTPPSPSQLTPDSVRTLTDGIDTLLTETYQSQSRESSQKRVIEAILDQFEDGFLIVGEDLNIQFSNASARRNFAEGRRIVDRQVIEAFLDHRVADIIQEALRQEERFSRTIRLEQTVEKNEETMERFVTVLAGPLPSPSEGGVGVWVILRDESERYHLEQIRKDFVANASHEIRTPLSIIKGYLENLKDGDIEEQATMRRFFDVMFKHAERLGRIVEDMLTISKLEGSPEALKHEVFDLAESVTDMVEHLQPLIQEKGATVLIDFPDSDRSMLGDRFYWDQVFFNLVENALKQNDREGLEVVIRLRQTEDEHLLQISDNGVGIPSSHISHIFKRFYRVEKSHSQEIKGTGLGLSIVRRAIEAHGGRVSVSSRPGIETTFTIRVPKPTLDLEQALVA